MSDEPKEDVESSSMDFPLANHTEIEEPSPLDRILSDGRSFNGGNWTSEELSSFQEGVMKYGTRLEAVTYIHRNLVKTRSCEEIKAKIDEIREIIKEHKEIILPDSYRKQWTEIGYRNIKPSPDANPNEDWSAVLCKVINHHHSSVNKHHNPSRDVFEKVFERFAKQSKTIEDAPVTDMQTARATPYDTQPLRWPVIYQFMKACSLLEEELPAINELEAAVVSKVLDSIEDEASLMPDSEKAMLVGLFNECQMNDFRLCEQDYPPTVLGATQLLVDPLRTRFHGIPEVGVEVELDSDVPSTSSSS